MRDLLKHLLEYRIENELSAQNPVSMLKKVDLDVAIDELLRHVYMFTRAGRGAVAAAPLVECACTVGHSIRRLHDLPLNTAIAVKVGAFLIYSLEELDLTELTLTPQEGKKHPTYFLDIKDDKKLTELWETVDNTKTIKMPALEPYDDWEGTRREDGSKLVKTNNKRVLSEVTPANNPMVYRVINEAQKIGWIINEDVLAIAEWAFKAKSEAFSEIWSLQSPEAKATKKREAKTILSMAASLRDDVFYHSYYLDFRGRKYPATAYLHEQGADLARGLLLRLDKKALGERGLWWLFVSLANNWSGKSHREDGAKTDKIPLEQRVEWALLNEEMILNCAERPRMYTEWTRADKPWQFLAAAIEYYRAKLWSIEYDRCISEYESHLEVFVDGL
jgi:hypothetical protein